MSLLVNEAYRPLPSLYFGLSFVWLLSSLSWAFITSRNRHSQVQTKPSTFKCICFHLSRASVPVCPLLFLPSFNPKTTILTWENLTRYWFDLGIWFLHILFFFFFLVLDVSVFYEFCVCYRLSNARFILYVGFASGLDIGVGFAENVGICLSKRRNFVR